MASLSWPGTKLGLGLEEVAAKVERWRERAIERRLKRDLKSLREILGVGISHRRGKSGTLWRFPL